jgi:Ca-activated chloride channel family protein
MFPRIDEFHNPWILLLLVPAVALVLWLPRRRRSKAAIVFPTVAHIKGLRPTLRQRLRWIVPCLEIAAVIGLILAAARPRRGDARTVIQSQGIAIQMVLDRSGSMEETMKYRGEMQKKIDIVKDVFIRFVQGDEDLPGRKTDLIGLTTFARFTEESCPLVTLHEPLITTVKNLTTVAQALDKFDQPVWEIPEDPREQRKMGLKQNPLNATAIGDGIQRAVLSLVTAEEDLARGENEGGYRIQGKVIVLLTDGINNVREAMDPVEAGRYAAANGIRVYYVVLREPFRRRASLLMGEILEELDPDEILKEPRRVVAESGGRAYLARDGDELLDIYKDIDTLEKSEIGKIEFKSYHEVYRVFLIPAVAAAVLALLLRETVFKSIP